MHNEQEIKLTHFENPSLFYFRFLSEKQLKQSVYQIERAISQHATETDFNAFEPKINSIIGFFHLKWMKWIRVKIVSKESNGTFRFFLIDYGYHMTSANRESEFTEIPAELKSDSVLVKRGSLGLMPCEQVEDRETSTLITKPVRYWNAKAIEFVQSFNKQFEIAKFYFVRYKNRDGCHIGDVIAKTMQETVSIGEKLISMKLAMREKGIIPLITQLPAANFEKIFEVLCPEEKIEEAREAMTFVPSKPPIILPAGVILGNYFGQKPVAQNTKAQQWIIKNCADNRRKSSTSSTTSASSIPSANPPNDIFAFGERLRSPLSCIENVPFIESVKESLRSIKIPITKLQAHCWSQIHHGRSIVILGRTKSDATSAYMAAVVNAIEVNRNQVESVGPIAIVVTKSSTDVKMISKMFTRISPNLSVVEAFGGSDKKFELLNGCDCLVTTPFAFDRLIEGVTIKLFDDKRLRFVIFDGIDTMMQPNQSEINAVVRTCNLKLKSELNPQIIVTSCAWIKEISTKLTIYVHPRNLVVCIENFIEAAACVGCIVALEMNSGLQSKFSKLLEYLKNDAFKSNRTVVVANDVEGVKFLTDKFRIFGIPTTTACDENHAASKVKWLAELKGSFSILVTYDTTLIKMELRNVQHLIHFAIPKSWQLFSQRFALLLNQFYLRFEKKNDKTALSTRIFLDDENIHEFTHLINFIQTRQLASIPEVLLNSVQRISEQQELLKCQKKVSICSNIWKFGECMKFSCSLRHIFCDDDKPLQQLPTKTLVQFDLLSVKSATSFVIKILSHLSGDRWISWNEKNHKIEKFLAEDLQEFYEKAENRKPVNVKIGETYALYSDKKWQRCRLIDKDSVAHVYLIDDGSVTRSLVTKIVQLPSEFKQIEPLVYNLQLMNLVLFDDEEFSLNETIRELIPKPSDGCIFNCKIQMVIRDTIFSESFDAKEKEHGAVKLRMKSKLLKMKICAIDESFGEKLLKFVHGGNVQQEVNESDGVFGIHETLKVMSTINLHSVGVSWKNLALNSTYHIYVKHFINPDSFFIILDRTQSEAYEKAFKEIQDHSSNTQLENFMVGNLCALVKHGKTCRGKITAMCEKNVEILLVDYGEFHTCKSLELMELPPDLAMKIPFQTVHCRLLGVRPKFNMSIWPRKQSEGIYQLLLSSNQPMEMIVARNSEKKSEFNNIGMNYYDVVMIDPQTKSRLNDLAVRSLFAEPDKSFSSTELENNEDEDSETNDSSSIQKILETELNGEEQKEINSSEKSTIDLRAHESDHSDTEKLFLSDDEEDF